jgi:hypothetical protein
VPALAALLDEPPLPADEEDEEDDDEDDDEVVDDDAAGAVDAGSAFLVSGFDSLEDSLAFSALTFPGRESLR